MVGRFGLLRAYVAPQRGSVALMAAFLLGATALQLAAPQVARRFVDAVQADAAESDLVRAALLFLGLSLGSHAARVLAGYWSERVAWGATNALRADLTSHLLRLDLGFHRARTPGELIERVDGDVEALGGFFSAFAVRLAGSALLLVGVLGALYALDVRLGAAFTACVAGTLALLGWVRARGAPRWQADRAGSAAFYGYLGEVLGATEDVQGVGAGAWALRGFFARLVAWWPARWAASFWGQGVMMAGIVAFAFFDATAFGLGGLLFGSGALSLGAVYLVVSYAAMLGAPIETIRTQLAEFQRADASVARVGELLATRSSLVSGRETLPDGPLEVELRDVTFGYDTEPVLQGVSLRLAPRRVLGVLGPTGSGKTTLARLLFRFHDPWVGQVLLGGVDARHARLESLRARVGIVTQDVRIFAATLRDNVTLFDESVPDARLRELLDVLGLGSWFARLADGLDTWIAADRLSAGEAQLLALARVFLRDPGIVVLDEPSSRLDPATQTLLEGAFDVLLAGRTALVIAHRLATLDRADDVLLLENGRVVEHGPRALLAADPHSRFARLRAASGDLVTA